MSNIRVTYAGLMAFLIRLVSVVTGIVFTIIITRNLVPEELGLWRLIGGLVTYALVAEPIASYWVSRQIARGEHGAKTGLLTNGIFAACASLAYIVMIYFVSGATAADYGLLLLATVLIPMMYMNNTLDAINLGFRPQSVSYAFLAFEAAKIPTGLVMVEFFDMGLDGAILATFVAYVARCAAASYLAREKIRDRFDISMIRSWFRLSWLPLYNNLTTFLFTLDVLLFSLIVGSVEPLSFYTAATAISIIVGHSVVIAQALYPKLLTDNRKEYVESTIKRFMIFSVPLTASIIVFAEPALFVLNPIYVKAIPVVIITAVAMFAYALMGLLYNVLQGIERVDISTQPRFADYIRSRLFLVPTLHYMQYGSYIGLLVGVTLIMKSQVADPIDLIVYWSVITLATQVPFTVYAWIKVRQFFPISFPLGNTGKYVLGAVVSALIMLVLNGYILVYEESVFFFAPRLAAMLSIGGAIYFGITYAIDKELRTLARAVVNELGQPRK